MIYIFDKDLFLFYYPQLVQNKMNKIDMHLSHHVIAIIPRNQKFKKRWGS